MIVQIDFSFIEDLNEQLGEYGFIVDNPKEFEKIGKALTMLWFNSYITKGQYQKGKAKLFKSIEQVAKEKSV